MVAEMKLLYRRLQWVLDILDDCNPKLKELADQQKLYALSKAILERRTQVSSARAILREIIQEHQKEKESRK